MFESRCRCSEYFVTGERNKRALSRSRIYLQPFRRSNNRGQFVVLAGPDGSGKSTVASLLSDSLGAQVMYWRPGLLPMLARLAGRTQSDTINSNPHGRPIDGWIKALFRSTYYGIDFILGSHLMVGRRIQSGKYVIADRWVYDMVVDPRRYGLKSAGVLSWLSRFCRRPDLLVVLEADPSVILARKAELPLSEITRQYSDWAVLAQTFKRSVRVSTNEHPQISVQLILNELLSDMSPK